MNNYSVLFSSDIFPFLFVKLSRLSSTILHQQILSPLLLLLLIYLTCAVLCLFTQSCPTLCNPMECSLPDILAQGDSPGKNNGGGSLSLLQGIFLTQESNQDLLHCRWILYQLSYQGSPYNIFLYSELAIHSILHSLFHVKYEIHNLTSNFCPCAPTTVQISLLRKLI